MVAENTLTGENVELEADVILIASRRASNSDITSQKNWGKDGRKGMNNNHEYLKTSKDGIWAFGDATGKLMF